MPHNGTRFWFIIWIIILHYSALLFFLVFCNGLECGFKKAMISTSHGDKLALSTKRGHESLYVFPSREPHTTGWAWGPHVVCSRMARTQVWQSQTGTPRNPVTQGELRYLGGGLLGAGVNIYFWCYIALFPGYLWLSQDNQDSLVTRRKEIKFFL